ncbi:MAG: hypothetical protein ACHQIM_06135 [Sphingobacteriales bacterium]
MVNLFTLVSERAELVKSTDWTSVWTFFLTLGTFLLCYIGWSQLRGLKRISKADFLIRFTSGFFNPLNRNFIQLCDCDCLEFKEKKIKYDNEPESWLFPYFEVNQEKFKQLPIDKALVKEDSIRRTYTCYEIDDFLGYFEDIGKFEKKGFINIQDIYDSFDWYIRTAHNNLAIGEYLKTKSEGNDFYENFNYIFRKCAEFGESKLNGEWVWFWRLRWWVSNLILKR